MRVLMITKGLDLKPPGQEMAQKLGRAQFWRGTEPAHPCRSEGGKIEPRKGLDLGFRHWLRGGAGHHEASAIR